MGWPAVAWAGLGWWKLIGKPLISCLSILQARPFKGVEIFRKNHHATEQATNEQKSSQTQARLRHKSSKTRAQNNPDSSQTQARLGHKSSKTRARLNTNQARRVELQRRSLCSPIYYVWPPPRNTARKVGRGVLRCSRSISGLPDLSRYNHMSLK